MKNYIEIEVIFKVVALVILVCFYLVYVVKMIAQRKKGIITNQIAKGKKPKKVFVIEVLMKIATYSIVIAEVISIFAGWTMLPTDARIGGMLLAGLGDIIFALAVFTMKDSWRAGIPESDKTAMITNGIYRYSRNPAFLGFDFVYIGILLMYFNVVLLVFSIWAMGMLHLQILQEEKFLQERFDQEYIAYKSKVMRYLGRKNEWKFF